MAKETQEYRSPKKLPFVYKDKIKKIFSMLANSHWLALNAIKWENAPS